MNKSLVVIIGFVLFLAGAIAIILSLVGLQLAILSPIEGLGPGPAFLIKVVMTVLGLIIIYVSRTDTEE